MTKAYALFRELEFNALTREFADSATLFEKRRESEAESVETKYSVISNRDDLDKLIRKLWETEFWSFEVNDANAGERSSCYHKSEPLGLGDRDRRRPVALHRSAKFRRRQRRSVAAPPRHFFKRLSRQNGPRLQTKSGRACDALAFDPVAVTDDPMLASYLLDPDRSGFALPFLAQTDLDLDPQETPQDFEEPAFRTAERADWTLQTCTVVAKQDHRGRDGPIV